MNLCRLAGICNPQRVEFNLVLEQTEVISRHLAAPVILIQECQCFPGRIRLSIAMCQQLAKKCLWRTLAISEGIKLVLEAGIHVAHRDRVPRKGLGNDVVIFLVTLPKLM